MSIDKIPTKVALGASIIKQFAPSEKVNEVIEVVNDLSDGSISTTSITADTVVCNDELSVSAGTAADPSVTFTADTDSGIYRIGADNIGVSVNGAKVLDIATGGLAVTGFSTATGALVAGTYAFASAGAVGTPSFSFSGDSDTGIYRPADDTVAVACAGTNVVNITAAGVAVTGTLAGRDRNVANSTIGANAVSVPSQSTTYFITAAGVSAMTIVDPTATTHDGLTLKFISTTAQAHTLDNSAGSGFNAGGGGSDVGTFGGAIGDNIVITAYQGKWYVISKVNVTLA